MLTQKRMLLQLWWFGQVSLLLCAYRSTKLSKPTDMIKMGLENLENRHGEYFCLLGEVDSGGELWECCHTAGGR